LICHVDMDAFYASVEALDRPELKDKPVIVGGGGRGVVCAASYQARKSGVRSAMPMFQAKKLCPQGVFLPVRMERYRQASRVVMRTLESFTPLVEPVSVDEAFLDLAGTEKIWGSPAQAGRAIKEAVKRATGLTCSVGMARLRFLAKIASDRDKPDGLTVVEDVEGFLATVRLKEVSGVGKLSLNRLAQMGLTHLIQVRSLDRGRLHKMLGSLGEHLWDLAHGLDPTPVCPSRPVKSISHELTLDKDTGDQTLLCAHLLSLCEKVCARLRRRNLCGQVVTVKLKFSDHRLITRRASLDQPSDQVDEIYRAARRLLLAAASGGSFRLVGVAATGLISWENIPSSLFGQPGEAKKKSLARAEDELCRRFGEKALTRASVLSTLDLRGIRRHNERGE